MRPYIFELYKTNAIGFLCDPSLLAHSAETITSPLSPLHSRQHCHIALSAASTMTARHSIHIIVSQHRCDAPQLTLQPAPPPAGDQDASTDTIVGSFAHDYVMEKEIGQVQQDPVTIRWQALVCATALCSLRLHALGQVYDNPQIGELPMYKGGRRLS